MSNTHANTLSEEKLPKLLAKVTQKADKPEAMRVAFMLSFYAGLRVQEIAGLEWNNNVISNGVLRAEAFPLYYNNKPVLDKDNNVVMRSVPTIYIGGAIGKYGGERHIPLHPQLADALLGLYHSTSCDDIPYVIPSGRNGAGQGLKKRAHALKMRFNRMYASLGDDMRGFSSHSGRRTFITMGARKANAFGGSLRDIQHLAGHKNLTTTEAYIDLSQRQADLVEKLYDGVSV